METLFEIIEKMRSKRYQCDFEIENGELICEKTGEHFKPGDLVIEEKYRYEGDSDPADMAVIYGITSNTGTSGILVDAYGTYSDSKKSDFIKQLKENNK